jgi:hypothetical protein
LDGGIQITDPKIGPVFMSLLHKHFEQKRYGDSVDEIYYYERCLLPEDKYDVDSTCSYSKLKRKITAVIDLDSEVVLSLPIPTLANYIADKFLDNITQFFGLDIMDFNVEKYLSDLQIYFDSHFKKG